jgi:hypothetical protein
MFQDIADHFDNLVRANANAPTKVFDGVVDTLLASMADTLHGIAAKGAYASCLIALAHVDWVSRVAKVEAARHLSFLK